MIGGLAFHHVGVACDDIDTEAKTLGLAGYTPEGERFIDARQGVEGMFLGGQSPRLELLQPITGIENGVLAPWLRAGHKMYHLAYETSDLAHAISRLRDQRAKLVVEPVPAVAFDGRCIAFVMLPNRMLIELISRT